MQLFQLRDFLGQVLGTSSHIIVRLLFRLGRPARRFLVGIWRQALVQGPEQFQPPNPPFHVAGQVAPNGIDCGELSMGRVAGSLEGQGLLASGGGQPLGLFPGMPTYLILQAHLAQRVGIGAEANPAGQQHAGRRCDRPRFLLPDQPVLEDLLRQQVGLQDRPSQSLQRQSVARAKTKRIILEGRGRNDLRPAQGAEFLQPVDVEPQALRKVSSQPGELHGVAQRHHVADLRRPVDAGEVADRALQLGQQIAKHGPHGLKHGLGILGRGRVAFEVFRLGKRQLQLFREGLGEMTATQRNAPLPDPESVGHDQVRGVGAQ